MVKGSRRFDELIALKPLESKTEAAFRTLWVSIITSILSFRSQRLRLMYITHVLMGNWPYPCIFTMNYFTFLAPCGQGRCGVFVELETTRAECVCPEPCACTSRYECQ